MEELNVSAEPLPWLGSAPLFITGTPTQGAMVHRHTDVSLWYVIDVARDDPCLRPDPREFDGGRWWSFEELAEPVDRFDPHIHRFVRKLRYRRGSRDLRML